MSDADDIKVNEHVATAELPPQSIEEFEAHTKKTHAIYGQFFKTFNDSVLFSMLPLKNQDRAAFIKRALEIEQENTSSR